MKRQVVIGIVAAVAVTALFFVVLLKPVGTKISETKTKVEAAKAEAANLRLKIRQLQAAQRDAPAIAARLAKFDLLLPRTADIPTFIRQVQEAADLSDIDLTSIAPSPPAPITAGPGVDPATAGQGVFTLNVVLNVNGGFFRMRGFLQRMESLQRVLQINNIALSPVVDPNTGVSSLQSTITLQMFVVNPSAPIPGRPASPSPSASPTQSGSGGQSGPATPAPTSS